MNRKDDGVVIFILLHNTSRRETQTVQICMEAGPRRAPTCDSGLGQLVKDTNRFLPDNTYGCRAEWVDMSIS